MSLLRTTEHIFLTRFRRIARASIGGMDQEQRTEAVDRVRGWRYASAELSAHTWQAACLLILVAAAVLRLYHLSLKPMHHDEGVNAYFLERLFRDGIYHYDPANYQGPTLYYFALLISSVIEIFSRANVLTTVVIRLVPAIFGIATVALLLSLRKQLGEVGVLAAAALVTVSPGAVYFSRDFIHEALLVFFTLAVPVAMLRYRDTLKPKPLMLASAALALMFATKETAAIAAVVLLLAFLATFLCLRRTVQVTADAEASKADTSIPLAQGDPSRHAVRPWLVAAAVFSILYALFYSSFGADPSGIFHGIESFRYWVRTGSHQHRAPWYTYFRWMAQAELPILGLGIVGTILALWRRRDQFALFAAFWGWGMVVAYSLLPYKTPWLTLNCIVPMAIVSGYAIQAAWDSALRLVDYRLAQLMLGLVAATLVSSLTQTITLNFVRYDDVRLPYVYMQTNRELISLVEEINTIAAQSGSDKESAILVTSREYWPLPWYLRDYRHVGYPGRIVPPSEEFIVASDAQEGELIPLLGTHFRRVGSYHLRPGVTLVLYARTVRATKWHSDERSLCNQNCLMQGKLRIECCG
jgi:uncharacterized protein (TIGR03663 family)